MNKNVEIRRIQSCVYLLYEKNFHFSYADSQVFTGISENFFKKKCCKSLEDEKKFLPLHPQNERGDAVESAPVPRKSDL